MNRVLKSLYWKLALAFTLVAFLTAALVALLIRVTSADRLSQLIIDQQRSNLETALQTYYTTNGSWAGVAESWRAIQVRTFPTPAVEQGGQPGPQDFRPQNGQSRENLLGLVDSQGRVVVPVDASFPAGAELPADQVESGYAVSVNGARVGTIITRRQSPGFNPQEALFLTRTNRALVLASLVAMLVAVVLGVLLARQLAGPLQALTQAAQSITRGQLEQQVRVASQDEIGQLAEAFNRMSQEVSRVNHLRKQMTADIAHDLRTPLTVISGYIESMRDGVLKPTPQRLELIYSEIELLQKLVDDLRMLSLAEAGELSLHPQRIAPRALLERAAGLFWRQAEKQNIGIVVETGQDLPEILVDEARMMQVLGNLISNSLRYTPVGGQITLSAARMDGGVDLCVKDNGEGIDAQELPYIFNRFHRADKSRHSETGETGLGLAIVKALVESQGGASSAESTPGAGTTIRLTFPAAA